MSAGRDARTGGRGFTFTLEFLGDGRREAAPGRRNRLATADLDDLTYDAWWCPVRFRSPLITAELAGYAPTAPGRCGECVLGAVTAAPGARSTPARAASVHSTGSQPG